MTGYSNGTGGAIMDWDAMEAVLDECCVIEPCSSCDDRGHVVEHWTGSYWLTFRGCDVCGMRGEASEVRHLAAAAASCLSC